MSPPTAPASTLFALLALALVLPLATHGAEAGAQVGDGRMPIALEAVATGWDGKYVYLFGGSRGGSLYTDTIYRYQVDDETFELLNARLPGERGYLSAVWSGDSFYLFGGGSDEIIRFTPVTNSVTVMNARFPEPRSEVAAIAGAPPYIYVAGGCLARSEPSIALPCADIMRYNVKTDSIEAVSAKLPTPRFAMAVAWDGRSIYYIGGINAETSLDEIVRFRPEDNSLVVLAQKLPQPRGRASATFNEQNVYVFGGERDGDTDLSDIVRFNPQTGSLATLQATLPTPRSRMDRAFVSPYIYLFGGRDGSGALRDVVRFDTFGPTTPPANPGVETTGNEVSLGPSINSLSNEGRGEVSLKVGNNGPGPRTFEVTASFLRGGWTATPGTQSFTLAVGEAKTVAIDVVGPAAGGNATLALVARAAGSREVLGESAIRIPMPRPASPQPVAAKIEFVGVLGETPRFNPNGTINFTFAVSNVGSVDATVTFAATGEGAAFDSKFEPASVFLPSSAQAEVHVRLASRSSLVAGANPVTLIANVDGTPVAKLDLSFGLELPAVDPGEIDGGDPPKRTIFDDATQALADHPVATTVVVGTTSVGLVGAALAMRRESWQFGAIAPVVGLFTRLAKPQVLKHGVREKIHQAIVDNPGITFSALRSRFELNVGTLVYHLQTLERHQFVTSRREGQYRRFYPVGKRLPDIPEVPLTDMQGQIMALVASEPLTQGQIAERLHLTKQGANYHIKTLERKGVLKFERRGEDWVCVPVATDAPPQP